MPDDATPMAETLGALHDIMRAGKVRHFGFSNYRGWQIADMVHLCDRLGVPRPIVSQPYYNILNRGIEVDVLPACAHFGIGVAVYSSLAGGLLAGKYHSRKAPPRGSRASRQDTKFSELEFRGEMLDRASKINAHARSRGMTASQFAMAWVLNNRHVTCAIAGPRTLGQWRDNLGALRHKLDADDEAFVSSLVPAGQPSTPGFIDPWFPVPARPTVSGGA